MYSAFLSGRKITDEELMSLINSENQKNLQIMTKHPN